MTIKEFAKKTGWPYQELMNTDVFEFNMVLFYMDLQLTIVPKRKRHERRTT